MLDKDRERLEREIWLGRFVPNHPDSNFRVSDLPEEVRDRVELEKARLIEAIEDNLAGRKACLT